MRSDQFWVLAIIAAVIGGILYLDFTLFLVLATALSGAVWALDRLFFAKHRAPAAGVTAPAEGEAPSGTGEPVPVEYARSFFPVLLLVLLIRSFLGEPFKIPSSSMMPTLLIGDFVLVNKFSYGLRLPVLHTKILDTGSPQRGDVMVFRFPGRGPDDPQKGVDYIKRVVGLPGDVIEYRDKQIFVNGEAVPLVPDGVFVGVGQGRGETGDRLLTETLGTHTHQILHRDPESRGSGRFEVPTGHYFVMGDNRDNSLDGRFWGFVPDENLVGRAVLIWMNFDSRAGGVDFSRIGTVIK